MWGEYYENHKENKEDNIVKVINKIKSADNNTFRNIIAKVKPHRIELYKEKCNFLYCLCTNVTYTPFIYAIETKNKEMIEFFINKKYNIQYVDFEYIISTQTIKILKYFIEKYKKQYNQLMNYLDLAEIALKYKKNKMFIILVEAFNSNYLRPYIISTVKYGNIECFLYLLSKKARVPKKGLLRQAIQSKENSVEMLNFLLQFKNDLYQDTQLLQVAIHNKNIECLEILLEKGVYIHRNNDKVLRRSFMKANIEVLKLLFKYGASAVAIPPSSVARFVQSCEDSKLIREMLQLLYDNGMPQEFFISQKNKLKTNMEFISFLEEKIN